MAEDYARVGEALIGALEDVLGDDLDAETRHAWRAAYGQVARTMTGAAHDPVPQAA